MTKSDAMNLLSTSRQGLALVLDVDQSTISKLPNELSEKKRREVMGAALDYNVPFHKVNIFTKEPQCKNEVASHNE